GVPVGGHNASISADGRYVTFITDQPLVAADTDGNDDVYVYDRTTGTMSFVSHATDGTSTGGMQTPAISGDGTHVAFSTLAENIAPGADNGHFDVFEASGYTGASYTENGAAMVLSSGLTLSDVDNATLASATV